MSPAPHARTRTLEDVVVTFLAEHAGKIYMALAGLALVVVFMRRTPLA